MVMRRHRLFEFEVCSDRDAFRTSPSRWGCKRVRS